MNRLLKLTAIIEAATGLGLIAVPAIGRAVAARCRNLRREHPPRARSRGGATRAGRCLLVRELRSAKPGRARASQRDGCCITSAWLSSSGPPVSSLGRSGSRCGRRSSCTPRWASGVSRACGAIPQPDDGCTSVFVRLKSNRRAASDKVFRRHEKTFHIADLRCLSCCAT